MDSNYLSLFLDKSLRLPELPLVLFVYFYPTLTPKIILYILQRYSEYKQLKNKLSERNRIGKSFQRREKEKENVAY